LGYVAPRQAFLGAAKSLLLMRVGTLAWAQRIPNYAETTLFLILLFCPRRAKLWVRRGKAPAAKPRRPARPPHDRDRPPARPPPARAPKPGDPAPACLLEKALWVPPTTNPFRWAPGGKPKKGKRKGRRNPDGTTAPDGKSAPVCPRPVSHDHSA